MIKNRMQMMRLELALLQEIHDARDASECKCAIGYQRNRCMKLQPGIRGNVYRMPGINWRYQGKTLKQQYQWRGECAHQRKAIRRAYQHVDQRHRPGKKDKNLE